MNAAAENDNLHKTRNFEPRPGLPGPIKTPRSCLEKGLALLKYFTMAWGNRTSSKRQARVEKARLTLRQSSPENAFYGFFEGRTPYEFLRIFSLIPATPKNIIYSAVQTMVQTSPTKTRSCLLPGPRPPAPRPPAPRQAQRERARGNPVPLSSNYLQFFQMRRSNTSANLHFTQRMNAT